MKKYLFIYLTLICSVSFAQTTELRKQIQDISKQIDGTVGVSILHIENRDTLSINGDARMVMHSTFKFPLAMFALHRVDEGKLQLDQLIPFSNADFNYEYAPLHDKYPGDNVKVPVREMIKYMVSLSDNPSCDKMIGVLGGTTPFENYVHSLGVKGIAIKATEAQMASAWNVQYTNWCSPKALTQLLEIVYKGNALSKTSNDFLWKALLETSTGTNRLKGLLPAGTKLAHKTGTSPTNDKGLAPGTNDAGIIVLPNGKHVIVSVFVGDSTANLDARELVIAKIAKAVYDHYSK